MKTKMKRQGSTELSRFAVGALATAGASVASGATVQIAFANNVVSTATGITNFVSDLTGDDFADIGARTSNRVSSRGAWVIWSTNKFAVASTDRARVKLPDDQGWKSGGVRKVLPFSFTDPMINNGAVTSGLLDVEGYATRDIAQLQIHRLIFDDSSTTEPTGITSATTGIGAWSATSAVPEASTSLGLLALGAGGILTRRRTSRKA